MLHAQMPEPVSPTEHPPIQEPTEPATPVEDPAPGESVPEIPIPDRLASFRLALLAAGLSLAPLAAHAQSAPQSAVPAPLPPGARADTPGGSTQNGVVRPPGTLDSGINQGTPPQTSFTTPIIPPPGASGSAQPVVPK